MFKKILFFLFLIVIWEISCKYFGIQSFLLPPPSKIASVGWEKIDILWFHTKAFMVELLVSFVFSIIIGFCLAVFATLSRTIDESITPLIIFFQGVPKLAIAPFILIFFGFGLWPKIFIATLMGFVAIYIGTLNGLKTISSDIMDVVKVYNVPTWKTITKVRIPHSIPSFFTGLKISIPSILGGVIIGEFMVGNVGLAYLVFVTAMSFDVAMSFAAVFLLSTIGVILFQTVSYIERKYIKYGGF